MKNEVEGRISNIPRVKLLIITAGLIITSTWLPGGLLPQWAHDKKTESFLAADGLADQILLSTTSLDGASDDNNDNDNIKADGGDGYYLNGDDDAKKNNKNSSSSSKHLFSNIKKTFRRRDKDKSASGGGGVAVADLRIDSKGMLLHPTCDSHNQSISSTAHALVHVRCTSDDSSSTTSITTTSSSSPSTSLYINGQGNGGYFGIHGLHLASIRDTSRLFCGDISRAKIAQQCLPILVKAIRLYQPSVYEEFVKDEWNSAVSTGLPLCCTREEMRKPINKVNITNCGIPCTTKPTNNSSTTTKIQPSKTITSHNRSRY